MTSARAGHRNTAESPGPGSCDTSERTGASRTTRVPRRAGEQRGSLSPPHLAARAPAVHRGAAPSPDTTRQLRLLARRVAPLVGELVEEVAHHAVHLAGAQ